MYDNDTLIYMIKPDEWAAAAFFALALVLVGHGLQQASGGA